MYLVKKKTCRKETYEPAIVIDASNLVALFDIIIRVRILVMCTIEFYK